MPDEPAQLPLYGQKAEKGRISMNYALNLTTACNMACRYCTFSRGKENMTFEMIKLILDKEARSGGVCGIEFTGGEPLLQWRLIHEAVRYGARLMQRGQIHFDFRIATNGLLLTDERIDFARQYDVTIALYHDGLDRTHDQNRVTPEGSGTYVKLQKTIKKLLLTMPYSPVYMTVEPSTAANMADSVEALYQTGFRVICIEISPKGRWTPEQFAALQHQYQRLARFYFERTLRGDAFYLSPFEEKMQSYALGGRSCLDRCELGINCITVSPDGVFYPCRQLAGQPQYQIGSIRTGIDHMRRYALYRSNGAEKSKCVDCVYRNRCKNSCACKNFAATGSITNVSPVCCAHEKTLIPVADDLAKRLLRNNYATFLQKPFDSIRGYQPEQETATHSALV